MVKKRRKTGRRWVETGPLAPWMLLYAQWLVQQPGAELVGSKEDRRSRHPKGVERVARASFFASRVVQAELVRKLEKRKDFREYFEKLQSDLQFQARELLRPDIAENIEIRREGLRRAAGRVVMPDGTVKYGEMDVKAVEHYTRPMVDLAFPKQKLERQEQAPRVTINLIGARPEDKKLILQALTEEEEPQDIDYEIIPQERQLGDGDDD